MSITHEFEFELGEGVRDVITKIEGVVTSQHHYITGCDTYGVTPTEVQDGKPETTFFDVNRLERTGAPQIILAKEKTSSPVSGGPQITPPKG